MDKKALIIGGYGNVGRVIASRLGRQFPGQVIVAGRNYGKAEALALELEGQVIPKAFDISHLSVDEDFLEDVGIVIMCLDLENIDFVRRCVRRGIHYIDISANYSVLSAIEKLSPDAEEAGATAVLSVGVAPGLSNLMVKHCQSKAPDITSADIYIMLGMGDVHGDAAIRWTLGNLNSVFAVREREEVKQVNSFEDGKSTLFPGRFGKRTGYRFNFSDQHVLPRTLKLGTVSTRFCLDTVLMTGFFAVIKKTGLSRLLTLKGVERLLTGLFKRFHFGSSEFVVKVDASELPDKDVVYACSLRGECEGRITGIVAAKVAEKLIASSYQAGVFHIEQLFVFREFLEELERYNLKFEENGGQCDE